MLRFLVFIGEDIEIKPDTERIQYKMAEINFNITIITLNINGLNSKDTFLD